MEVTQLADLLVSARSVRAMTLGINPDWTVFLTYKPSPGAPASPANGSSLHPGTRVPVNVWGRLAQPVYRDEPHWH
jgi:hypothetical protein